MNSKEYIEIYKTLQMYTTHDLPCPRCGKTAMKKLMLQNKHSKYEDVYICEECSSEESESEAIPLDNWFAVKMWNVLNISQIGNSTENNKAFLFYEENSHELSIENGAFNNIKLLSSIFDVEICIQKALLDAKNSEYRLIDECEELKFYEKLLAGKECQLTVYDNGDENSSCYYSLVVKIIEALPNIYPKTSLETQNRLKDFLVDSKMSEVLGKSIVDVVSTNIETPQKIGYYAAKAILDGNIEDLLMAITGWRSSDLLDIVDLKM